MKYTRRFEVDSQPYVAVISTHGWYEITAAGSEDLIQEGYTDELGFIYNTDWDFIESTPEDISSEEMTSRLRNVFGLTEYKRGELVVEVWYALIPDDAKDDTELIDKLNRVMSRLIRFPTLYSGEDASSMLEMFEGVMHDTPIQQAIQTANRKLYVLFNVAEQASRVFRILSSLFGMELGCVKNEGECEEKHGPTPDEFLAELRAMSS